MKLAFLYAGQGSQKEKMGLDFYNAYPQIQHIFHNKNAGFDIAQACFSAPLEQLSQTRYTQACLAAFAAIVTDLLYERGIKPNYAAGLSLGEYSALYASGVFDIDTLIDLLAYRGKVMAETTKGLDTKMVAVMGLESDLIRTEVEKASNSGKGIVACANFNCKGQTVIGGHSSAVDCAVSLCTAAGARRCLPLNVSAPFHTPIMKEAAILMAGKLTDTVFGNMSVPIIFNATGDFLVEDQSIAHLLEIQVKMPVLFEKTILKLSDYGVDTVIEIGPGNAIAGFIKKTAPHIKVHSIDNVASFIETLKALEV